MRMIVLISTCPTVWCVVTPCGYNSTLENGQTLLCFHTWPAPHCFHTWPALRSTTLLSTTFILTCDLFHLTCIAFVPDLGSALCFITIHSTALLLIQICACSAELHCTLTYCMHSMVQRTIWHFNVWTSLWRRHQQPKAVITHTRVSVPQLLMKMSMNLSFEYEYAFWKKRIGRKWFSENGEKTLWVKMSFTRSNGKVGAEYK